MGLKNKSQETVELKYNGVDVVLKPGETVDVRDFDIQNSEVLSVEHMLQQKHGADKLEQVKTLSNMSDAQINQQIKDLQLEIEDLKEQGAPREEQLAEAGKQVADLSGNLEAATKRIEALEGLLDEADPKWRKAAAKSNKNS